MFRALALLLGIAATALVLEIALRFLPVADATLALPVDASNPVPRLEPDRELRFSKGWNFAISTRKRTNNYGFLSDRDYAREGPRPLVAVIGDSYVEAMQVRNPQAFPALLDTAIRGSGRVYGLGASGTALSTYLAYAAFAQRELAPDALVFSIVSNDYDESLLAYNSEPRNHYFVEGPDGELVLWRFDYSPSLAKRLLRRSALVRYLVLDCQLTPAKLIAALRGRGAYVSNTRADADARRLTESRRAVDAFFRLLPEASHLPAGRIAFLMDGVRPELYSAEQMAAARQTYPVLMRDYFMAAARERGYEVVDLQGVFEERHRRTGERFEFPTDDHWNAAGHRVAAEAVCRSALFDALYGPSSARADGCRQLPAGDP